MGQGAGQRDRGEKVRGKREGREEGRGRDREWESKRTGSNAERLRNSGMWIGTRRQRRTDSDGLQDGDGGRAKGDGEQDGGPE